MNRVNAEPVHFIVGKSKQVLQTPLGFSVEVGVVLFGEPSLRSEVIEILLADKLGVVVQEIHLSLDVLNDDLLHNRETVNEAFALHQLLFIFIEQQDGVFLLETFFKVG